MALAPRPGKGLSYFPSIFLLTCMLLSFSSCGSGEEPIRVDLSKKEEIALRPDPNVITYGYLPQYLHRVSFKRHQPLIEYLKRETGLPIKQVFADTFDEFIKMVGQGRIDICYSNPFTYIKIADRYGAKAFARIVEMDGKDSFRGQIICRKDNPDIRSIEDCRGKRWIAVDPSSAGGYLWALGLFWDHGIRREDFAEIAFAPGPGGKQEKVVMAVHAGRYDIGSIREGTLDVVSDKVDIGEIRIVAYTAMYPGWMYAARSDLNPQTVLAIRNALLKLDCSNIDLQPICEAAQFQGVIPAKDSDFDAVRELSVKIGMDLNE